MLKRNTLPPDFSDVKKWVLGKERLIYCDTHGKDDFFLEEKSLPYSKKDRWVGYLREYVQFSNLPVHTALAAGREMDFFGKGVRIKTWGLLATSEKEGEERLEIFSVFYQGKWHTFAHSKFVFRCAYTRPEGIRILVYERETKYEDIDLVVYAEKK